jgi:hypothetical protein
MFSTEESNMDKDLLTEVTSVNGLDYSTAENVVREVFTRLVNIDVSKYTKKKNHLTYLPWADAYRLLMLEFPDAMIHEYWFEGSDGLRHPYYHDDTGYYVTVGITIKGIEKREKLPVLDYRNKPIEQPNSFDINTTTKRCWVKAMARWGLGLYLYAGEEIPNEVNNTPQSNQRTASPKPRKSPKPEIKKVKESADTIKTSPHCDGITDEQKAELEQVLRAYEMTVLQAGEKLCEKFKLEKQIPDDLSQLNQKQADWFLRELKVLVTESKEEVKEVGRKSEVSEQEGVKEL